MLAPTLRQPQQACDDPLESKVSIVVGECRRQTPCVPTTVTHTPSITATHTTIVGCRTMLTPISVPPKPHGDVANAAAAGADDGDGGYGATMRKLEDFFASARFTDAISEFMGQHVSTLQFTPLDKEQPLQ